jgi:hypothetical protein
MITKWFAFTAGLAVAAFVIAATIFMILERLCSAANRPNVLAGSAGGIYLDSI